MWDRNAARKMYCFAKVWKNSSDYTVEAAVVMYPKNSYSEKLQKTTFTQVYSCHLRPLLKIDFITEILMGSFRK